jgi:hypothetical protein
MAGNNNSKDMPQRAKIAELLADLMPPLPSAENHPVIMAAAEPPRPEDSHPIYDTRALALEDLEFETTANSAPAVHAPLPLPVPPALPKPTGAPVMPKPLLPPTKKLDAEVTLTPVAPRLDPRTAEEMRLPPSKHLPDLANASADLFLQHYNWRNAVQVAPARPAAPTIPAPIAKPAPAKLDLIPLGNLTTAGFFALMNWRNDPEQVRHPVRDPLAGIDADAITLLKSLPFFGYGPPEGTWTVAAVMSQVAWQ